MCVAVLIAVAMTMTSCRASERAQASGVGLCATTADYSAQSLPINVAPPPGPALLYAPAPRAPQLENTGVWEARPILISGASAYRCGEFLYQDWLFDDRGAAGAPDLSDPHGLASTSYLFSRKAGTLTYPKDPVYGNNAADLVELRIKALEDTTAFRVTLNTLHDPERVAFTIALGNAGKKFSWPYDSGVESPAEYFLTVHGSYGELRNAESGELVTPGPVVRLDVERRQFDVRVARAAWDPKSDVVRVSAGVGLWDGDKGTFLKPGLVATQNQSGGASVRQVAMFNVAFREEPMPDFGRFSGRTIVDAVLHALLQARFWRERAQADALRDGDISEFFAEVDFAKLREGRVDESGVPKIGHMNRIYASRFEFGQGIDYDRECGLGSSGPCDGPLIGQLQPYAVYVPSKPPADRGYGLSLLLHALSGNYNQFLGTNHASQLGESGPGFIVATPAARGPDGFYSDIAEADVFEVWADVARHYPLDPDVVALSGVSMGGIGSFRLAARYPDLFGRMMAIVASTPVSELMTSLRNIPIMMTTSVLDELQPIILTEATISTLNRLGLRYDALTFLTWDHLTPSTYDHYPYGADFLGQSRVDRNPPHVSYTLNPSLDSPRAWVTTRGAYWVTGIELRDPDEGSGTIDAFSEGFGLADAQPAPLQRSNGVLTGGNHEPAPFRRRTRDWLPAEPIPIQDRIRLVARNVSHVTLDPKRARVSCAVELEVESDGPIETTLVGC